MALQDYFTHFESNKTEHCVGPNRDITRLILIFLAVFPSKPFSHEYIDNYFNVCGKKLRVKGRYYI